MVVIFSLKKKYHGILKHSWVFDHCSPKLPNSHNLISQLTKSKPRDLNNALKLFGNKSGHESTCRCWLF